MEAFILSVCGVICLGAVIFAVDRHLWIKEIEADLNNLMGDLLVARDSAKYKMCVCCMNARVLELKNLIRKHFKL